jgi:hypothetical protein
MAAAATSRRGPLPQLSPTPRISVRQRWSGTWSRIGAVIFRCSSAARVALIVLMTLMPLRALAQDEPPTPEEDKIERARIKYCASLPETKRRQADACKTEDEKREDAYQKIVQERLEKEKPSHTSFLRWLHLDTLWMPTTFDGSIVGLVGSHITVANIDRLNFFGPPGVMLLMQNVGGEKKIIPALTWGFSVYLIDLKMPGEHRQAQVYLNLAKVWETGNQTNGMDMAGISLTWKK